MDLNADKENHVADPKLLGLYTLLYFLNFSNLIFDHWAYIAFSYFFLVCARFNVC